jgi:Branched-chain amino acid ATP-binding cassette transporter
MLKLPDDPHGSVNAGPMTPADFQKFFPLVDDWMWATLAAHAGTARPVASFTEIESGKRNDWPELEEAVAACKKQVEHHMNLVMSISDRVVALDFGRKIAEGTPDEVRNDREVIRAYLGTLPR